MVEVDFINMRWFTLSYFLYGWGFFIQEEKANLLFLVTIVTAVNISLGSCLSCLIFQIILIVVIRRILAGGICHSSKRLDGKVVVITGANTGIGKETATDLCLRGAKVILACRDMNKAKSVAAEISEATMGKAVAMKLDLASLESIRSFVEELKTLEPQIHILINNAGVMMCPYQLTTDGFEMHIGTNHLGHFLLTNLLIPSLASHGKPAHIITLSSIAHKWGKGISFDDFNSEKNYTKSGVYGSSKLANILFTRQLGQVLKGTNVKVFSLHPGCVQSELGRHLPFYFLVKLVTALFVKTTAEGAQTTIYCVTEANQSDLYYFSDCTACTPSAAAQDDKAAEKLWKLSEKLVGLSK